MEPENLLVDARELSELVTCRERYAALVGDLEALRDQWLRDAREEDTEGEHFLTECAKQLGNLLAAHREPR